MRFRFAQRQFQIKMAKYEFDEVKHRHTLDGKSLTGCTTILGVIAKPALIPWAANMVANCIKEKADFYHKPDSDINYYYVSEELLEEARTAHSKRKDKAGEWGTKLHAEVERYILNTMAIDGNAPPEYRLVIAYRNPNPESTLPIKQSVKQKY